jgi:hypothetical protein
VEEQTLFDLDIVSDQSCSGSLPDSRGQLY